MNIKAFTLDEYVSSGYMTKTQKEAICSSIEQHKNILVVGGISSGKTTLVNAIILEMAKQLPNEKIEMNKDTGVIQFKSKKIVQGELKGEEALDLLNAGNTEQAGWVCDVHAISARSGLSRIQSLVSLNPACPDAKGTIRLIAQAIHILVCISSNVFNKKTVSEICEVVGVNNQGLIEVKQIA